MDGPTTIKELITADGRYKTSDVRARDSEGSYRILYKIKELMI